MLKQVKTFWLNNLVVRNFFYLTIGSVASQLLGLFAILKVAFLLEPSNYGIFTFLTVQSQILITLGDFGNRNIIIRKIARDKNQTWDIFRNGIIFRVMVGLVIISFYVFYNHFFGNITGHQVLLLSFFSFFSILFNLGESIFWGHEKMLIPSLINILYNSVWFVCIFLLPKESINVNSLFFFYLLFTALKTALIFVSLWAFKILQGNALAFWESTKKIVYESWPYFSLVIIMLPINYFSNNFLAINSSNTEIGYFNLAQKITGPLTLILGFALSAIFPNLSVMYNVDKTKFDSIIIKGIKYYFLVSLLLCFIFVYLVKGIVTQFFSSSYLPAIKICQMQMWFVFLMGINSVIGTLWGASNNEKLMFKTGVINLLFSLPFLYYGSKFGALGLSYGFVFSFIIFEIYLWLHFKKSLMLKISGDSLLWLLATVLFIISYYFF